MCRQQPRVVGCSRNPVKAAVASFGPPRYVRAATGSLVDAFEPRIRGLVAAVSADAGGGESRRGSAGRSDSLIEFVKTNVAILPLLILTATTNSDELSYGLDDTAVDGFWIGPYWESTGQAPLADTLASILDSAPYDGAAACAEEKGGDQLQMILDRPAKGREPGPPRSPLNTEESTETICKDNWLMRLGDQGRTVNMAVPPTAHAMSGIHQQHNPADVKSLGDAIHFTAHGCARAESVRGDCAVSANDWTRAPATSCLDLNAAIDQAAFATYAWTDLDPVPGRYETGQGARWNIVPPPARRSSQQAAQELASGAPGSVIAVGSLGFGSKSWMLQRADAWPRWLLRGSGRVW
jgi:hypothetical protein